MPTILSAEPLNRLISRVSHGDRKAFEQLYKATSGRLYAVSYQMLQRRDLAEEAVQDAFIKVWHNAADYHQDKGEVLSWMVSICRYRSLDMLRAKKVRSETSDDELESHADLTPTPDEELFTQRDKASIDNCMEGLVVDQRNAIQLAYFRGLTIAEASKVLVKPLGSVKSWVRRGLEQLKRCLG